MHKVMITGAAGLLGTLLSHGLSNRYEVSGLDRARSGRANVRRRDMTKSRSLEAAFRGLEAVVDLAGLADPAVKWSDVWKNNVPATMNALEAARRAEVRRVVFASSNRVTGMYELDPPYSAIVAGEYGDLDPHTTPLITSSCPVRPDGPYALGKALGEAAARYYSDMFGLSVICLRIGTVNAENRPRKPRDFATLLTHEDLLRLVDAALTAPDDLRFGVYYGVSRNTWRFWDIARAAEEIGYDPRDDAEAFRDGG
jgi:nucleoside-diphosphate-sugar epimerase